MVKNFKFAVYLTFKFNFTKSVVEINYTFRDITLLDIG